MRSMLTLIALSFSMAGCSCGGPGDTGGGPGDDDDVGECSDVDNDGYGAGAGCDGPDCDDGNPEVWTDDQCQALCDEDPHSTGCDCDQAAFPEPEICYQGPAETLGVGPCRAGLRTCDDGSWSICEGQQIPSDEICDELDNDCDTETDEGVTNECGTCGAACEEACVGAGEGCEGFDIDNEGDNVEGCEGLPPEECVTLGGRTISLHVIWIANSSQGTVSRIDTRTREEEGRYYTSPLLPASSASPSRTSVDYLGDVVVGNRAFGQQASVTRIASEDCPAGDTSTGAGDILDWGDDACVLWNSDVGCGPDGGGWGVGCGIARAVAVQDRVGLDGVLEERVWVGMFNEQGYYELDRSDGSETGEFADCSPCTPYGAAIDRDGILSSACLSQNMCRFDTSNVDDVEVLVQPGSNYGITVDQDGIVWTGGSCTKYDPEAAEFTSIAGCSGNGVGADGNGYVWVGQCWGGGGFGGGGSMCRIDAETLEVTTSAALSFGIGVDFDGFIWGVGYSTTYVDIVDGSMDPGAEDVERVELGLTGPYTYSDMTGYQLRNATDPQGSYAHVFEGCDGEDMTGWEAVTWEAVTPEGTSIQISVRHADDLATLATEAWIVVGSTVELESPAELEPVLGVGPHGRYLEVKFTLFSESRENRPMLTDMGVQWSCDVIIG